MAKITVLEAKTFGGKAQGFKITLDDGRSGNMEEKQSDKGLRVGDEVVVMEIPYTSKVGNTSTLYGLRLNTGVPVSNNFAVASTPQTHQQTQPKAPSTVNVAQMKFESRMKCLELAHNAFIAGKLDEVQAKEHAVAWVSMADGLINDIFTK